MLLSYIALAIYAAITYTYSDDAQRAMEWAETSEGDRTSFCSQAVIFPNTKIPRARGVIDKTCMIVVERLSWSIVSSRLHGTHKTQLRIETNTEHEKYQNDVPLIEYLIMSIRRNNSTDSIPYAISHTDGWNISRSSNSHAKLHHE